MANTLSSPGVRIREVDLSLRVAAPTGVGVMVMGYTDQGPTDEVLHLSSLEEYESVYGKPTNAAERYSYHSIRALFNSPANVYFSRLPYGSDEGDIFANEKYSALIYPAVPYSEAGLLSAFNIGDGESILSADTLFLASPIHVELKRSEYEDIINGETDWKDEFGKDVDYTNIDNIGTAAMVVLNKSRTTINDIFEGYYVGISDNRSTDPSSKFDDVTNVFSLNDSNSVDYVTVPLSRLDFRLSSMSDNEDSASAELENIPTFNINTDEFGDVFSIGVFKLRRTPFNNSEVALSYVLTEGFVGSFDNKRELQNPTGGPNQSIFYENVTDSSNNIRVFVNSHLQNAFRLDTEDAVVPKKIVRVLKTDDSDDVYYDPASSDVIFDGNPLGYQNVNKTNSNALYPLGVFQERGGDNKDIGSVLAKVERVLDLVENPELFDLDILSESGLGTIFTSTQRRLTQIYDETKSWEDLTQIEGVSNPGTDTVSDYMTIYNAFNTFCQNRRKDCMFIADPIRHIFIRGENTKVLKQLSSSGSPKTFSQHIYWPLRNQFAAANSSYAATYATWARVFDTTANKNVWVPYSSFAAALYANMPNVWDAPAGFTRGINNNLIDIAFYPNQKERDQLYKISLNPVKFSATDGFVTFGQKTLLAKPSAFDRINVRRVFLFLEKATLNTAKYFVFEPNTLFTRTQVVNVLSPLFQNVKDADGITDFLVLCNEKNNTAEVIEQNQLKIDIYIKPTKTAEFILVDFIATRQDANFEELI